MGWIKNFNLNQVKMFSVLFIMIFFLSLVSAQTKTFDLENNQVSIYDNGNKTLDIKLLTPQINQIEGLGEQLVQYYDLKLYTDVYNIFTNYETYNLKNFQSVNRNIKLKYGIPYNFTYQRAITTCKNINNPDDCTQKISFVTENRIKWYDFTSQQLIKLNKGNYLLGVFADVYINDYIEGIPIIKNVRLNEFASWNSTWEVNLQDYYSFEESSGDLIDVWNYNTNGTSRGVEYEKTGINNYAYNFTASNLDMINISYQAHHYGNDLTIRAWIYPTDADDQTIMSKGTISAGVGGGNFRMSYRATDKAYCGSLRDDGNEYVNAVGTTLLLPNHWYQVVCVYDTTGKTARVYVNGTLEATASTTGTYTLSGTNNLCIGTQCEDNNEWWDGKIDEIAVWEDNKSNSFILSDYNSGVGLFLPPDIAPVVNLSIPTDNYDSNLSSITFNCSALDDNQIHNLTLFVWNSTAGIYYSSSVSGSTTYQDLQKSSSLINGSYSWNCLSYDNLFQSAWASTNYSLNVSVPYIPPTNSGLYDFDFTSQTNIFLLALIIAIAIFMYFVGWAVLSGVIFMLLGVLMAFNSVNIIISALVMITGLILILRDNDKGGIQK